ncbi:hypothetical protein EYS14_05590 [Alteromonadaceae bacterium M269]|nr:hypothetical protein EYS14_05590 [Alteromonadaceae bacterium M269]
MKQVNKTIIGSVAAILLSGNAFATTATVDKTLVEAEIAANLRAMTAEITAPVIAETAKIQLNTIAFVADNKVSNDKNLSTEVEAAE